MPGKMITVDGNYAASHVAYALSEVAAIYPITPSSTMGEYADEWASVGKKNIWGKEVAISEMQSEGGAAGAVHGALAAGALTTTFTASQGLLLMIPNMYKIAGELTPCVFHVAARALAAQALSIFGDHADVMAVRQTGWAMLSSASVQEAHDFALIAHAATLTSRIPFVHFFDGFRTSHEVAKIALISEETIRAMIDDRKIEECRLRALPPDHPVLRGTTQNPDVYFQAREAANPFYDACAAHVERAFSKFAELTGRRYSLYEYVGAPDAERVIVLMGSGCEAVEETVEWLQKKGEKVGVLKVRLYRPLDVARFAAALPKSVKFVSVLDRTKEPGAGGEPLYLDVVAALNETGRKEIEIVGGRYGLSSKEFTPAMIKAVFENLSKTKPKHHFTIGINDDVTHTSLPYDASFSIEPDDVFRGLFYGLGADGTVGANKESIKIIGENTSSFAQGYFVYDSKKSGSMTVSHIRFGPRPIRSTYLVSKANFIAIHQPGFIERYDILKDLVDGGIFLLNSSFSPEVIWGTLPEIAQKRLIEKKAKFFVIDASRIAKESGMKGRINTIMQTCFFAVSGVLPREEAIESIKKSIKKAYGKKGEDVVQKNIAAVENTIANLHEVTLPKESSNHTALLPAISMEAPTFVREVLGEVASGHGDELPVSAMPVDGTYPTGTAQWEKRNLSTEVPVWNADVCIQCGKCVFVCPHAVVRTKVGKKEAFDEAPEGFLVTPARLPEWKGLEFTLQISTEDCTGCALCVDVCPTKDKSDPEGKKKAINMTSLAPIAEASREYWKFFTSLPEVASKDLLTGNVRQVQTGQPLFEFSGACAGCGETPYVRLLTQLFGDRLLIANATGCSSIYGGNLPTTPYTVNAQGRGPAWANSLFEDNAEFGLGFRASLDRQHHFAEELVRRLAGRIGDELANAILAASGGQKDAAEIEAQRERVAELKNRLHELPEDGDVRRLLSLADHLVRKSVWILGGDGWGYDIGYGGLDHVLASGRNVKVLLMDTEVYSNTGGQCSKATPLGATAKFAASGKKMKKKDLGLIAMQYGGIYVASVALGAKDEHTLKAFIEAEAYDGPALIIAYSHCISHGINMVDGLQHQKAAVQSGHWLLYRFHPDKALAGENPLTLDSAAPNLPMEKFYGSENRFRILAKAHPEEAVALAQEAGKDALARRHLYEQMAARK